MVERDFCDCFLGVFLGCRIQMGPIKGSLTLSQTCHLLSPWTSLAREATRFFWGTPVMREHVTRPQVVFHDNPPSHFPQDIGPPQHRANPPSIAPVLVRLYTWRYAAKIVELGDASTKEDRDPVPNVPQSIETIRMCLWGGKSGARPLLR